MGKKKKKTSIEPCNKGDPFVDILMDTFQNYTAGYDPTIGLRLNKVGILSANVGGPHMKPPSFSTRQ